MALLALFVGGVWRRPTVRMVVVAVVVAVVGAARALTAGGTVPLSFELWGAALVVAVVTMGVGWRSSRVRRRLLAVATVLSVIVASGIAVNAHYGYYPTVADLLHRPLPDQIVLGRVGAGPAPPTSAALIAQGGSALRAAAIPARGRLLRVRIPPTRSGFSHRAEWVYLPPAWFEQPTPALPVVVLLPGTPGTTEDWIRAGAAVRTANRWAATHSGRAPVMVFADPNGSFRADTECVDNHGARVDTYLSIDVPHFIQAWFSTSTDPARWAIAGVSAGGTCALTVALRHPDVYRTLVDLSGETAPNLGASGLTLRTLFEGSATVAAGYDPVTLLRQHDYPATHAWFAAGSHDRSARRAVEQLIPAAHRSGIDTRTAGGRGGHTWGYWSRAFDDAFAWINTTINSPGATP